MPKQPRERPRSRFLKVGRSLKTIVRQTHLTGFKNRDLSREPKRKDKGQKPPRRREPPPRGRLSHPPLGQRPWGEFTGHAIIVFVVLVFLAAIVITLHVPA
jgi:hypothetical protein